MLNEWEVHLYAIVSPLSLTLHLQSHEAKVKFGFTRLHSHVQFHPSTMGVPNSHPHGASLISNMIVGSFWGNRRQVCYSFNRFVTLLWEVLGSKWVILKLPLWEFFGMNIRKYLPWFNCMKESKNPSVF